MMDPGAPMQVHRALDTPLPILLPLEFCLLEFALPPDSAFSFYLRSLLAALLLVYLRSLLAALLLGFFDSASSSS